MEVGVVYLKDGTDYIFYAKSKRKLKEMGKTIYREGCWITSTTCKPECRRLTESVATFVCSSKIEKVEIDCPHERNSKAFV